MSEAGEAPVNPYTLLGAVNASSAAAHGGWLIFIALMSYALVAVAGVTHKDLLLARDIPLPILQVGIEMTRFFLFAPVLLVLFHVGVVTQLVMLARKAHELDQALRPLEVSEAPTHPLRLELDNFFFVQALAGPDRSRIVNGLLYGLVWLTLVVLPVALLLYIQLAFLPYHDETITWVHRIALVADILLLALVGVFLTRPERSFGAALGRSIAAHPLTSLVTVIVLGAVAAFSFLVATVPDEPLDRIGLGHLGRTSDGRLLGLFERNLNVTDQDLVIDRNVTPGEPSLSLRRRDLRHARLDRTDLHQADMTGARLDGASLVGADLRGATIHCADVGLLVLSEDRRAARCPSAVGADLSRARLAGADLAGLDLAGARLEEADLTGANLAHASLVGANLYAARLERADLTGGVALQGANLASAALQGADLTGAALHGADLANAGLKGAVLEFASLDGASLRGADLEAANLYRARLPAADLTGAGIRAASLRDAWVWGALPPPPGSAGLADLEGLRTAPPEKPEAEVLEAMLKRILDSVLEARLRERLALLLKPGGAASAPSWSAVADASRDRDLEPRLPVVTGSVVPMSAAGADAGPGSTGGTGTSGTGTSGTGTGASGPARGDRPARLTAYLAHLACRPRWAAGSVATGIARRARSSAFNGDPAALYDRLAAADCPAGRAIPAGVLRRLADSVERSRGN